MWTWRNNKWMLVICSWSFYEFYVRTNVCFIVIIAFFPSQMLIFLYVCDKVEQMFANLDEKKTNQKFLPVVSSSLTKNSFSINAILLLSLLVSTKCD